MQEPLLLTSRVATKYHTCLRRLLTELELHHPGPSSKTDKFNFAAIVPEISKAQNYLEELEMFLPNQIPGSASSENVIVTPSVTINTSNTMEKH